MKKNNKGFTLAELLIVVAIIAVLVAIAIPVFTAQLHRAQDATEIANARAIYAERQADFLTKMYDPTTYTPDKSLNLSGKEIKTKNGKITVDFEADKGYTVTWAPGAKCGGTTCSNTDQVFGNGAVTGGGTNPADG